MKVEEVEILECYLMKDDPVFVLESSKPELDKFEVINHKHEKFIVSAEELEVWL